MLVAAERPLVWAGGGALRSGAGDAVGELAAALAAPVITTYMGAGLLPPSHPCAVPGPVHVPEVGALWDEADVVLAVGTDFDGMMTQNWTMPAPPRLIAVNVDEADANKSYPADLTLVGDAKPIVEDLARGVHERAPSPSMHELEERLRAVGGAVLESARADDPEAVRMLEALERTLPADAIVVADMCIPGYWIAGFHRVPAPRRLAYPMGWGTLGFGFPASIGSALAGAGPAVCVCGDGGFLFACGELATVAQEGIPLTLVIVDDGGYGMLRFDQRRAGDEPFGVDLARPDFAALAASFGIPATTVDGFGDDFQAVLAQGVKSGRATVIVVNAALKPPPTTSPRWYRRTQEEKQR
jgi:acetolactate synthase-1/2/3 large subunit